MDVDQLLPRELLVKTSDLDQADWNYRTGPLGTISRRRFDLVVELLGTGHGSLLEVGYGSGVAMPLLAKHTREVHGVDVHDHPDDVARSLRSVGVTADLVTGSVTDLPYPDARFDAVVSISSLEFVDAIDTACVEMARVLRPGGVGVFVTPG